jgi:SulP family sulfate permease
MEFRIPFIEQLKSYHKGLFVNDLVGGLTVGVMLIPQGMAYAFLAGVPAVYGLYASLVPLILYMIFGSSRYVTIGPAALISLLLITGLDKAGITDPDEYLNAVFVVALIAGLFQLLLGLFKLGNIINFISQPVLKGFIIGAAFTIILSQVKHIFGIPVEARASIDVLQQLYLNIGKSDLYTILIGTGGILFLIFMKRLSKRIPSQLIVVAITLIVTYFFHLNNEGVQILGKVPSGIPMFNIPEMNWELISALIPVSLTIGLISFIEVYAIGVSLEDKKDGKAVSPNQELIAIGLGKAIGSFFYAFPTSGSFSRSAVNKEAGTKTNLAGLYAILLVVLTLLFLTPYFYYLPKAALGAIIIVAIFGLIDIKYVRQLAKIDTRDLIMLIITVLITFFIGIQEGIITGVILSIASLTYNTSYPHIAELGLVKGTTTLRNVSRFEDVEVDKHILIIRIDAPLTFSNVPQFAAKLSQFEKDKKDLSFVLLNASAIDYVDSTALNTIKEIAEGYRKRNIRFAISSLKGPVRDKFKRSDMFLELGEENFFAGDLEALESYKNGEDQADKNIIFQSNK